MTTLTCQILEADPLCSDALALLRQAAAEAQALYPALHDPAAPAPTNQPNPPRGVYLIAWQSGEAVGMAAHRPIDADTTELRRMFVSRPARRRGVAAALLAHVEAHARRAGFSHLVLETGIRQAPAMALYAAHGFSRIAPFGDHGNDPTGVCYSKRIDSDAGLNRRTPIPTMTITSPSADDARAIAQVNVRSWQQAYKGLMPDAFLAGLSVDKREASWRQWIGQPNCATLVARAATGQICGYVAYARSRDADHTPGTAEIVAIYVDPDHWHGGTGTRLLDRASAEIAALGFLRTTLWVLAQNTRAIRFYARHGFRPDACPAVTIEVGGTQLQELRHVRGGDA